LNTSWANSRDFYQQLVAFNRNLQLTDVLDFLFRKKIEDFEAERWGDKTPSYVKYIPIIHKIFPGAKFIHMIRDGRDTVMSAQKKWGVNRYIYMDNYYLMKNWVNHVTLGRRASIDLKANQYLEVYYEELVTTPEKTIKEICNFLEEEFRTEMLDHTRLARRVMGDRPVHSEVQEPISISGIFRWKTEMDMFTRKIADNLAGKLLVDLNYEKDKIPDFSRTEKLRLRFLQVKYLLTSNLRAGLYKSGLLTLNRRKRDWHLYN
jgi:hypothetical protein